MHVHMHNPRFYYQLITGEAAGADSAGKMRKLVEF